MILNKPSQQMSFRNPALDGIKGFCIILMVIGHSGAPQSFVNLIYSFHMPAFFILSGFLFKEKYLTDLKGFVKRKFQTIWWPFVLWSIIFILCHNFLQSFHLYDNIYSFKEIGKKIIKAGLMYSTEQLLGGFWFLTALLFSSIITLLYLKFVKITRLSLVCGIITTLFFALLLRLQIIPTILYFNSCNFLAASFFITGILMAYLHLNEYSKSYIIVTLAIVALVVGTFCIKGSILSFDPAMLLPYYLSASMITWGLIIVFWKSPKTGVVRYLVKIGSRTLDILVFHFIIFKMVTLIRYLSHDLPLTSLSEFPVPGFHNISQQSDCYWILYSIMGICISLLISRVLDYPRRYSKLI